MNDISIIITVISCIATILSITIAILSFAGGKSKDAAALQTRLAKIETDLFYIRQSIDKDEQWREKMDAKYSNLESRLAKLEGGK